MKQFIETDKLIKMAKEYAEKAAYMRKRGLEAEANICHTCIGVLFFGAGKRDGIAHERNR